MRDKSAVVIKATVAMIIMTIHVLYICAYNLDMYNTSL